MTDSTQVILPAAQAFLSGKLEMPVNIPADVSSRTLTWADFPANYILVMVSVILIIISIKALKGLFPHLLDSASRWKGCVNIDSSIRLRSDRNLLWLIWLLPMMLVADRYSLFPASILGSVSPRWHVFATSGVFAAWLLLRTAGFVLCALRVRKVETLRTAFKCLYNFIILLGIVLAVAAGLFSFIGVSEKTAQAVVLYVSCAFYLTALHRESQILNTFCSHFRTFLYLCALEFIPTGALIAGNILF